MSEWDDRRTVRFMPTRTDNLRDTARPLVGQVIEVEYAGEMDEGPYDGQSIWMLTDRTTYVGWLPDEDLIDV